MRYDPVSMEDLTPYGNVAPEIQTLAVFKSLGNEDLDVYYETANFIPLVLLEDSEEHFITHCEAHVV